MNYTFVPSGFDQGRLRKVEMLDGSAVAMQKVEYTYFNEVSSGSSDLGSTGDLVQVKTSVKASNGTDWIEQYTQYRYYKSDSANGKQHQLKSVFEADAIQRAISAGDINLYTPEMLMTKDDTYLVASTAYVTDYTSRSFTYYTSNVSTNSVTTPWTANENLESKYGGSNATEYDPTNNNGNGYVCGYVKTESVNAGCASCGGGSGGGVKHSYFYMVLNGGSTDPGATTTIVVEDTEKSDNSEAYRQVFGLNFRGVAVREAFIENPTAGTPTCWCMSVKVDADLNVIEQRAASAHTDFDKSTLLDEFFNPSSGSNDANTVNSTSGVITLFSYDDGDMSANESIDDKLYVKEVRVKKGSTTTNNPPYLVAAWTYVADGTNQPYWLATEKYEYPTQTQTKSAGKKTAYAYAFWDAYNKQIKSITATEPTIASGQNGSGTPTAKVDYFDKLGRLRWTKDGEGYINYYSYHADLGILSYAGIDINPNSMPSSATSNTPYSESSTKDGDNDSTYDSSGIPSRGGSLPTALALVTMRRHDRAAQNTR